MEAPVLPRPVRAAVGGAEQAHAGPPLVKNWGLRSCHAVVGSQTPVNKS